MEALSVAEPNTESMVREAQGRRAEGALQMASEVLDKRETEIINGVLKSLDNGPISPDNAIQQWLALSEVRRLRKKLESIGTTGQRAAQKNAHLRPQIG